jgi:hypothetical protein
LTGLQFSSTRQSGVERAASAPEIPQSAAHDHQRRIFMTSHFVRNLASILRPSALPLAALVLASASQPLSAQNLLSNPSFENGLAGWTLVSGSVTTVSYGSVDVPTTQVGNVIGGGGQLLRDSAGNLSVVEQIVQVGPLGAGTRVRARGFFGGNGGSGDQSRLVVRFLNAAGGEISIVSLPYVSTVARNSETVLMLREEVIQPPPGTDRIAARIEMQDLNCCAEFAIADNISLELTSAAVIPNPLPLQTELLVNPSFELGWSSTSPLTLVNAQGWEGVSGTTTTLLYSPASSIAPSNTVSTVIGGGSRLLVQGAGNSGIKQRLDVRGNASQIATGLEFELSAYLGGGGGSGDNTRVEVLFLDADFLPVGAAAPTLGPVTAANRNLETVVMRRELRSLLPSSTSYIDISVLMTDLNCCNSNALADKLSAKLRLPSAVAKLQLNTNLIRNGGFEQGDLPGSPLQLNDPNSWIGVASGSVTVDSYGLSNGLTPSVAFASANGLGGLCARGSANAKLQKSFSLVGYEQAIQQGRLFLDASAWLGGFGSTNDDAGVAIRFASATGAQIDLPELLGPVTALDRANQTTLLLRASTRQVPQLAVSFTVELEFRDLQCCTNWALADEISVSLRDTAQPGLNYCTSTINSTGAVALMSATGSASISANNLVLRAGPVQPSSAGLFFYGFATTQAPFGNGTRCITPPLTRFPVSTANNNGVLAFPIDYSSTQAAQLVVGATAYFQSWYRDPAAGGENFNTSDGYRLTFAP